MNIVYVVRTVVEPGHESEWLRWQEDEHVANLLALPGYLGVHRFADARRPHHYLNLWRIAAREAQGTEAYRRASLTPWFERIRPFYDVSVTFSVEHPPPGGDGWRQKVQGAVIERWSPDGPFSPADADTVLARPADEGPGVLRVLALAPLAARQPGAERSAASTVRVTFLDASAVSDDTDIAAGAGDDPVRPPELERRTYRALGRYLSS